MLNELFSAFNARAAALGIETTRTIGDGYMAVVGVPTSREDHAGAAAELALAMRDAVGSCRAPDGEPLRMRFGINSGPLLAAVVGTTKFSYDAWGDAVNPAARMESHGLPGQVQVTEATYGHLKDAYAFERRGVIDVKGKGPMPCTCCWAAGTRRHSDRRPGRRLCRSHAARQAIGPSRQGVDRLAGISSWNRWYARQDSNLRPLGPQPNALSTELRALGKEAIIATGRPGGLG